jgi:hypothetical protein
MPYIVELRADPIRWREFVPMLQQLGLASSFGGSMFFGYWSYRLGIFSAVDVTWLVAAIITVSGAVITAVVTGLKAFGPVFAEYRARQLAVNAQSAQGQLAMIHAEFDANKKLVEVQSQTIATLLRQVSILSDQSNVLTNQVLVMHGQLERGDVKSDAKGVILKDVQADVKDLKANAAVIVLQTKEVQDEHDQKIRDESK